MKKTLIAAALAVCSTTAFAQNVTVYGIIDTGFQQYNNGTTDISRTQDSALATSRLGFRGTEDLGGGLKANFQLESTVVPSTGSLGSTTTTGQVFDREAWVGMSGNFGEIRVGRQDVTYAQDVDSGVSQGANLGLRPVNGTAVELGSDQNQVIKYISPKVGPLTLQVGYASGNGSSATAEQQADQLGAHAKVELGKLSLHAAYQKNDGATTAAQRDFTVYGAAYDLGFASVGASYAEGDVSTTGDVTSKSTVASIRVPLSSSLALHGVYGQAEDGTQASNGKGTGYIVGVTKALSKRTTVYAAYTSVDNEANSSMSMRGVTAPTTAGLDVSATTVGISHTF